MLLEGRPLKGRELEKLKQFLGKMELEYDEAIEYSVCILNEEYEIIGTGSVDYNVIKCVAIDPEYQGQGLSAMVLSNLIQYEFERSRTHIFIYTKPKNLAMFSDMGFHSILQTQKILFMENRSQGFAGFLQKIERETPKEALEASRKIGAVVANCNPFTYGHRYLLEKALEQCDYLHLFVLSDNRSIFPADMRFEMVKQGMQGLDRIILHKTSDYMISAATFPTYFFKDKMQGEKANCRLDLELFGERIAKKLHITERFVGTEPNCAVTRSYNEEMKKILPLYGIQVHVIQRKTKDNDPISASEVRKSMEEKNYERVKALVPDAVYRYLMEKVNVSGNAKD